MDDIFFRGYICGIIAGIILGVLLGWGIFSRPKNRND